MRTTNNLTNWQTAVVNSNVNIYFIKMTYENDIPILNLRVSELPTSGRVNIITSTEFTYPRNSI